MLEGSGEVLEGSVDHMLDNVNECTIHGVYIFLGSDVHILRVTGGRPTNGHCPFLCTYIFWECHPWGGCDQASA